MGHAFFAKIVWHDCFCDLKVFLSVFFLKNNILGCFKVPIYISDNLTNRHPTQLFTIMLESAIFDGFSKYMFQMLSLMLRLIRLCAHLSEIPFCSYLTVKTEFFHSNP